MERKRDMLVLGRVQSDALTLMGRNQRRAHLLAPRAGLPKGVQKFRTWDEAASWTKKMERKFLEQRGADESG